MKINHILNPYFEFLINTPPFLSILDTFKAFFLIWPVPMMPSRLSWNVFWIESPYFILNGIIFWIESPEFSLNWIFGKQCWIDYWIE